MALINELPATLRIGPYDCTVVIGETKEDIWGAWTGKELKLEFSSEFPSRMLALDTVLHEISHAVFQVMHLRGGDKEERIVGAMATGWSQVLRDNPKLLAWLVRAADGSP